MTDPNQIIEQLTKELATVRRLLAKVERERDQAQRYGDGLRQQLELLSAKLHLHQQLRPGTVNVGTQTEFRPTEEHANNSGCNSWSAAAAENGSRIADLVREAAEDTVLGNDYVYDQRSKTYYSRSSGWYYYPERDLFYDPHSKNYYKYDYDKKSYEFYSSLDETEKMKKKRKRVAKTDEKPAKQKDESSSQKTRRLKDSEKSKPNSSDSVSSSEVEEIEISDDEEGQINSGDDIDNCDIVEHSDDKKSTNRSPACVRMMVVESSTLELGSLLLVTCLGGRIGNDSKADVWITDISVSRNHAEVRFDDSLQSYVVRDCNSKNGTYLNGTRLNCQAKPLHHLDRLSFGDCQLQVHIHDSADVTCDGCEPGLVQANLKLTNKQVTCLGIDKEQERRRNLKNMKKKYMLEDMDYERVSLPDGYKDRSGRRRTEVGSDNPYEKTEMKSIDEPLNHKNKGFRMLEKMGWKSGDTLGGGSSGLVEPIQLDACQNRAGLGSMSASISSPPSFTSKLV